MNELTAVRVHCENLELAPCGSSVAQNERSVLRYKADDPIKRIGSFLKGKRGVRKKAKIGLSDFVRMAS